MSSQVKIGILLCKDVREDRGTNGQANNGSVVRARDDFRLIHAGRHQPGGACPIEPACFRHFTPFDAALQITITISPNADTKVAGVTTSSHQNATETKAEFKPTSQLNTGRALTPAPDV